MEIKLPAGWTSCLLKDAVSSRKGKKPATVINYEKKGYDPYLLIDELEGKPARAFTNDPKVPRANKKDVLLVWDGSIGKCASGMSGAVGSTMAVLSPKKGLNTKFLEYFIRRSKNNILETSTGTGLQHINKNFLKTVNIPLPPNEKEQELIADKLDILIAKVKDAQSRLDRIPTILGRFRQSVLAAACSGRLTADWREDIPLDNDQPATWKLTKLEDLCELITKGASPKWQGVNYSDKGVLFVTSENVGAGNLLLNTKKYVELKINEIQPRSILRKGDLLTNIVGASIGRSAIFDLDDSANINQAVALIRLKNGIEHQYILYVLNSPSLLKHMDSEKVDVARANLSLKDVSNFPIPIPPLSEQQEIVRRVKKLFTFADQIEVRYNKAKVQVDKLEQSILVKAFRGELVSKDDKKL